MFLFSVEVLMLPLPLADPLHFKVILIFLLKLDLAHQINSQWSYRQEKNSQTSQDVLCDEEYNSTVRACIMASRSEDFGNAGNFDRVLVFRFNGRDIKIFIGVHNVSLPNASIQYEGMDNDEVPIYKEEIARYLHVFYMGFLVIHDTLLPLTAEWDGVRFLGNTAHTKFQFKLQCSNCLKPQFYEIDQCLSFYASCKAHILLKSGHRTMGNDYIDLLSRNIDYFHDIVPSGKVTPGPNLSRKPRSLISVAPEPRSCMLHLVSDHLFYKYVGESSVLKTVNILLGLINEADALFRSTDFDGNRQGDNIGFVVGKITVFRHENDLSYKLYKLRMTSEDYLVHFAEYDFSSFCLGVGFTFREFHGTTGTAYPAYSDLLIPGGICQKRVLEGSRYLSYNTAVITFLNNGEMLHQSQIMLTLVHEFGHSFGAVHDTSPECSGGELGTFIMNKKTTIGTDPNNRKFSACSVQSILPVIKKKGTCLIYSDHTPRCGNSIPESGEECDCGLAKNCAAVDPCCTPADIQKGPDKPCTLQRSKQKLCSPKVSSCCNDSCAFITSTVNQICNKLDTCSQASKCTGQNPHCPSGHPQPFGTLCSNGLRVCKKGQCSVATCEYNHLITCMCLNETDQCKLCCRDAGDDICKPASDFNIFYDNDSIIYQEAGAPCLNFGICDSFHVCLIINNRPSKAVLGFNSINEFQLYLANNWFYYALGAFAIMFIIMSFTFSYQVDDPDYLKALRYGKMLAIFAMGEYQTKLYRKILTDIDDHYSFKIYQSVTGCEQRDIIEALGRLKMFFPNASIPYLSRIAKISASERIAVKILLLQGFRMRTFTKKLFDKGFNSFHHYIY